MTRLTSPPTTAVVSELPNIYKATKAFIALACGKCFKAANILKGNQNRISLPEKNEYVIMTIINEVEHGRPIVRYEYDKDKDIISPVNYRLVEVVLQIDCYSDNHETARSRAQTISSIAMTTEAVDFFEKYGLSVLYADTPQNTTIPIDAEEYVQRWTVQLHLTYTHKVTLDVESFTAVDCKVVNVDVAFPPT